MPGVSLDYAIARRRAPPYYRVRRCLAQSSCRWTIAGDEATFEKLVTMAYDFKQYFIAHDQPIYENPSPGNKAGVSPRWKRNPLAYRQAGFSVVVDVLRYGERRKRRGSTC
ncbi:hypothetical protein ACNKHS_18585 [Shigella flexneri]